MFHQGVLNLSISFNSHQTVLSYSFLSITFLPGFPFPLPPYSLYFSSPPFFSTLRPISPAFNIYSSLHVTSFYFPFPFRLDFVFFLLLFHPLAYFPLILLKFQPSAYTSFPSIYVTYLYFPSLNIYLIRSIYFYSTLQLTSLSDYFCSTFHLTFPFLSLSFHLSSYIYFPFSSVPPFSFLSFFLYFPFTLHHKFHFFTFLSPFCLLSFPFTFLSPFSLVLPPLLFSTL